MGRHENIAPKQPRPEAFQMLVTIALDLQLSQLFFIRRYLTKQQHGSAS
jgi:hypothetical protein